MAPKTDDESGDDHPCHIHHCKEDVSSVQIQTEKCNNIQWQYYRCPNFTVDKEVQSCQQIPPCQQIPVYLQIPPCQQSLSPSQVPPCSQVPPPNLQVPPCSQVPPPNLQVSPCSQLQVPPSPQASQVPPCSQASQVSQVPPCQVAPPIVPPCGSTLFPPTCPPSKGPSQFQLASSESMGGEGEGSSNVGVCASEVPPCHLPQCNVCGKYDVINPRYSLTPYHFCHPSEYTCSRDLHAYIPTPEALRREDDTIVKRLICIVLGIVIFAAIFRMPPGGEAGGGG